MKLRIPETEGEMQLRLEGAREHLNHAVGKLRVAGQITDSDPDKYEPGSVEYHLLIAEQRLRLVWEGMIKQWGRTDGQLCPNQECLWNLAFPHGEGWYVCPHCFKEFWCRETDGGIEDYHCYLSKPGQYALPKPASIPFARDMGPSAWSLRPGMK
jgi:hypothetical protein